MRCKYCNEVIFKDFHKEEDCAMKDYEVNKMQYEKTIRLNELSEYIDLIKLEQTFRVKLIEFKNNQELRLKQIQELKPIAEKLNYLKTKNQGLIKDKELDREIRNIINKKFIGGVINDKTTEK
jgi:hypothetical protein